MAVSQKDIKLLWGRAASRCAICRIRLTEDKIAASEQFPFGEQAHIIAAEPEGPRGESILTSAERDRYHNLVLLCPTHHAIVDKNVEDYPTEKLHMLKGAHELWVELSLAQRPSTQAEADRLVLADVVDSAVSMCRLEEWEHWTSWALASDPEWPKELRYSVEEFRHKVMRVIWPPAAEELRVAVTHFSILIVQAADEFMEISQPQGLMFVTDRYYRRAANERVYDQKFEEFDAHLRNTHGAIVEAGKAANWMASVVRRTLNPMFLRLRGYFSVTIGPLADPPLAFRTLVQEYTDEERRALLAKYAAG